MKLKLNPKKSLFKLNCSYHKLKIYVNIYCRKKVLRSILYQIKLQIKLKTLQNTSFLQ